MRALAALLTVCLPACGMFAGEPRYVTVDGDEELLASVQKAAREWNYATGLRMVESVHAGKCEDGGEVNSVCVRYGSLPQGHGGLTSRVAGVYELTIDRAQMFELDLEVLHELGHVLQLEHDSLPNSVMAALRDNGQHIRPEHVRELRARFEGVEEL